ncbi:MAG: hypothetical protein ACPGUX_12885 [Halocynthiibacter sp.]
MSKFAINKTKITIPEPSGIGEAEVLFNYSISGHYPTVNATRLQLSHNRTKELLVKASRIRRHYDGTGAEQSVTCIAASNTHTALLAMFEAAFRAPLAEPAKFGRDGSWCYVTRYGTDPMKVFSWSPFGLSGDALFVACIADVVKVLMKNNLTNSGRSFKSLELEDDLISRMNTATQSLVQTH